MGLHGVLGKAVLYFPDKGFPAEFKYAKYEISTQHHTYDSNARNAELSKGLD